MVDARLGGVVVALLLRLVDDETRHRADIDDRARSPRQHVPAEGAAAPEQAVQIDVDDVEPVLILDALRRRLAAGDAGVVDQDVDAPVSAHQIVGDRVNARALRHVHDDDLGIVTLGAQGVATRLGDARVVVGDDRRSAGFRQRFDAAEADAAAAARDERDATSYPELLKVHRLLQAEAPPDRRWRRRHPPPQIAWRWPRRYRLRRRQSRRSYP